METYIVNEVFPSIIGEGIYAGQPALFIRMQGCHRRCDFCDEPAAQASAAEKSPGKLTDEMLLRRAQMSPLSRIVITGGEPGLQIQNSFDLFERMRALGKTVHVETTGDFPIPENIHSVHVSPKASIETLVMAWRDMPVWKRQVRQWAIEVRLLWDRGIHGKMELVEALHRDILRLGDVTLTLSPKRVPAETGFRSNVAMALEAGMELGVQVSIPLHTVLTRFCEVYVR